jgi:hypothetical protein
MQDFRWCGVRSSWATAAVLAMIYAGPAPARAENNVLANPITVNDNAGWSWFEDERAIIDVAHNKLVVGSVANASGYGGTARSGDIEVTSVNLTSGATTRFTLHDSLEADDHNSPAIWIRPSDAKYVAMYGVHTTDNLSRWRVTNSAADPSDITSWVAEQTLDNTASMTYSNLYYLPNDNGGAGRLYNFVRSIGFDPNILISSNQGTTFTYGGRLLTEGTSSDRPYVRYATNGNRIDMITTNRHPRDFDNSIYHAYIQDGKLYNSAGVVIDSNLFDGTALAPNQLTTVFATGTVVGGASMQRGWTVDLGYNSSNQPVGV